MVGHRYQPPFKGFCRRRAATKTYLSTNSQQMPLTIRDTLGRNIQTFNSKLLIKHSMNDQNNKQINDPHKMITSNSQKVLI